MITSPLTPLSFSSILCPTRKSLLRFKKFLKELSIHQPICKSNYIYFTQTTQDSMLPLKTTGGEDKCQPHQGTLFHV